MSLSHSKPQHPVFQNSLSSNRLTTGEMPRQNPITPAGGSVPPARSHAHQPQPSRHPGEGSRVGQAQHAAHQQAGQTTRYQPTPFPNNGMVQITRQDHPTTHPSQSVRPDHRSYSNAGQANGFVTENGRQVPVRYKPPVIKNQKQPDPGPPDGYIKENGREIPIWYNPPGIVDKVMTPAAQAEYDRVRSRIVHGRR